jgi:hypothetical protein
MRIAYAAFAVLLAIGAARADEVTDQLDQALAAYRRQDLSSALAAVDAATVALRQRRAEIWRSLLPAPLPGWTAEDPETTSVSPALLGGVTTASRVYRRNGERVEISIVTDSPILQGIGAMLSSVLSAGGAARTLVVEGRRLVYLKDDNSYTGMIGDKVVVKVAADSAAAENAVRQYVAAIDFAAIERAAQ